MWTATLDMARRYIGYRAREIERGLLPAGIASGRARSPARCSAEERDNCAEMYGDSLGWVCAQCRRDRI